MNFKKSCNFLQDSEEEFITYLAFIYSNTKMHINFRIFTYTFMLCTRFIFSRNSYNNFTAFQMVFYSRSLNSYVCGTNHQIMVLRFTFQKKRGLGLNKYCSQTLQNHISHIFDIYAYYELHCKICLSTYTYYHF